MSEVLVSVLSAVGGILGGGGLVALFLIPQTKRKENLNNDSLAISALKETLTEVRCENLRKDEVITRVTNERDEARKAYEDKCEESATAKSMLCIHMGCICRDPTLGQGDCWLKKHGGEPNVGADFVPIGQLLRQYRKKENENGTDA